MIPEDLYRGILRQLPLICVDIVIESAEGRYLLVKRRNEPLLGDYWVVGGRILHGEKTEDAVRRKLKEEVGIEASEGLEFVGYYEDFFDRNSFEAGIVYHTMSLVFRVRVAGDVRVKLDEQSSDFIWADALPKRFVVNG